MKFFTPELYIQFNSEDDQVANRAEEAWELAIEQYREHLTAIRLRMNSQTRKLAELCLHDAELLSVDEQKQSSPSQADLWTVNAIVSLKQDKEIIVLVYTLWDLIRETPKRNEFPFSPSPRLWLYDEFELSPGSPNDMFLHRVLVSDGSLLEIPFRSIIMSRFELPEAKKAANSFGKAKTTNQKASRFLDV